LGHDGSGENAFSSKLAVGGLSNC